MKSIQNPSVSNIEVLTQAGDVSVVGSNVVELTENGSIVKIAIDQNSILGTKQAGEDLVLVTRGGENITVKGFFNGEGDAINKILIDDNGELFVSSYDTPFNGIEFSSVGSIEEAMANEPAVTDANWVVPLVGLGVIGAIAAIASSSSDDDDNYVPNPEPTNPGGNGEQPVEQPPVTEPPVEPTPEPVTYDVTEVNKKIDLSNDTLAKAEKDYADAQQKLADAKLAMENAVKNNDLKNVDKINADIKAANNAHEAAKQSYAEAQKALADASAAKQGAIDGGVPADYDGFHVINTSTHNPNLDFTSIDQSLAIDKPLTFTEILKNFVDGAFKYFGDFANKLGDTILGNWVKDVIHTIENLITLGAEAILAPGKAFVDWVKAVVVDSFGEVGNYISGITKIVLDTIADIFNGTTDLISDIALGVSNGITQAIGEVVWWNPLTWISSFVSGIGYVIGNVWKAVEPVPGNIINSITQIVKDTVGLTWDSLGKQWNIFVGSIKDTITTLWDAWVKNPFEQIVKPVAESIFDFITHPITSIVGFGVTIIKMIQEGIDIGIDVLIQFPIDAIKAISALIQDLIGSVVNPGDETVILVNEKLIDDIINGGGTNTGEQKPTIDPAAIEALLKAQAELISAQKTYEADKQAVKDALDNNDLASLPALEAKVEASSKALADAEAAYATALETVNGQNNGQNNGTETPTNPGTQDPVLVALTQAKTNLEAAQKAHEDNQQALDDAIESGNLTNLTPLIASVKLSESQLDMAENSYDIAFKTAYLANNPATIAPNDAVAQAKANAILAQDKYLDAKENVLDAKGDLLEAKLELIEANKNPFTTDAERAELVFEVKMAGKAIGYAEEVLSLAAADYAKAQQELNDLTATTKVSDIDDSLAGLLADGDADINLDGIVPAEENSLPVSVNHVDDAVLPVLLPQLEDDLSGLYAA